MKVSELYNQVAGLGFESSLESDDRFYQAANRALLRIADVRPEARYHTINHKPLKNAVQGDNDFAPVERSTDLCFEAYGGKSYYFECDGNGHVVIESVKDGEAKTIGTVALSSDNRVFRAYSGIIDKDNNDGLVRLIFKGEYTYSVRGVAIYDRLYSDKVADVPAYEPYTRYDISKAVDDFLALSAPPITDDREHRILGKDYTVENGRVILLPYDKSGCYKVCYKHRPTPISDKDDAASSTQEIDLDPDLVELMPLACAIYILAEDEPSLVNHYQEQYQQRVSEIVSRTRDYTPIQILTNGW